MKKLISLMLALIMVFSLATVAFAADGDSTQNPTNNGVSYADSTPGSFVLKKTYSGTTKVTETLKFEVNDKEYKKDTAATAESANFDITIANVTVGENTPLVDGVLTADIKVEYPAFKAAGFYYFTISETEGDILGMNYSGEDINCVIQVGYDNTTDAYKVISAGAVKGDKKIDTYNNELKTTTLTLDKKVKGNMADENQDFKFTVTISVPDGAKEGTNIDSTISFGGATGTYYDNETSITSSTITMSAADDAYTISGIPVGAKIVVAETDAAGYTFIGSTDDDNIVTTGGTVDSTNKTVTIDSASASGNDVVIVNEKDESVSTGIVTDSAPYIILIAVCAVAAVAFVLKRRKNVEF